MDGSKEISATKRCGLTELLIFIAAIISGTACSICSKLMMQLHSVGLDGEVEEFSKPLFQTFGMFVGMTFGLVMHWVVIYFRVPFPGYEHRSVAEIELEATEQGKADSVSTEKSALLSKIPSGMKLESSAETPSPEKEDEFPLWIYFFLAIPSMFDLMATALCMCGLRFIDVSIYQMLRGSGIIFVALMKQHVLRHRLYYFQWVGVFWNVVSVFLVGATAVLASTESQVGDDVHNGEALLGVLLVMAGAFVQALQFVFEEKAMTMDIPSPPLLLIGMEGLWGTVLCVFVVYPLAYYLPGDDHGSYESPLNTWTMIKNSSTIQWAFFIYFFAIFGYNLFAVLVTFLLNSVWHAILDNFRPITVWGVGLFIYYCVAEDYGEDWSKWSYLQLVGMAILLYGTSVYNAPNAGSIQLQGQWYALGMDFSADYKEIEEEREEEEMAAKWDEAQKKFKARKESSFMGERSPMISVHTQALRGLGNLGI